MRNLHITELGQSDLEQIRSDSPSPPEAEYQDAVFTLPPNHNNPDSQCQISAVSLDSKSFDGEEDQLWAERLHRNSLHADCRANEEVIHIRAKQSDAPEKATDFQNSSLKLEHKTAFEKYVGSLRILPRS